MPEYRFWDKLADRYAKDPIADQASYQKKLEVTRSFMRPDMEVLEFGCGTGSTAILHAPYVGHIRAIDFSHRMLEIARARARDAGVSNISFEVGDIATLAVPEARYDIVLGLSVLHLLADPDAAIAKAFAMLKPGGVFISSTACLGDFMALIRHVAPLGRAMGLLPRINVMTSDDVESKICGAGFEIVHRWQPARNKALFIIGRKPDYATATPV